MTRFIFSLFLAVSLNITPLTAQSPTQPSGTIDVEDSRTKDAAIAVRIRSILAELGGYSDVTVTVSSGIVTLRGTTIDGPTASRLNEIAGRVAGVVAIENKVVETTDVVKRLNPAFERFWVRLKQFTAYLPLLAIAVLAFSLVVLLGFFVARRRQPWDKIAPNAFIADIYRQLIRLAALVAGLVVALDILAQPPFFQPSLRRRNHRSGHRFCRARHGREFHRFYHAFDPATFSPQRFDRDRRR